MTCWRWLRDWHAAGVWQQVHESLVAECHTAGLLQQTRTEPEPTGPVEQPVQPQARRQAQRRRLTEQSKTLAMRICTATGLSPVGRRIAAQLGAPHDLAAVIALVNREVNVFLGIPARARRDLDIEQIESAQANLETIGDAVEADVKKRIA